MAGLEVIQTLQLGPSPQQAVKLEDVEPTLRAVFEKLFSGVDRALLVSSPETDLSVQPLVIHDKFFSPELREKFAKYFSQAA